MPVPWKYVNPVSITFGEGSLLSLKEKLAGRRYCLITYSDNPTSTSSPRPWRVPPAPQP